MKYVSIDLETTGLDPEKHQTIEVGAILEDTSKDLPLELLPSFRAVVVQPDDQYVISPYVMEMHKNLFREVSQARASGLTEYETVKRETDVRNRTSYYCFPRQFETIFGNWLSDVVARTAKGKVTAAGKNFYGFDFGFLKRLAPYTAFHHRSLDPAMYYLSVMDDQPPSLELCAQRAGIPTLVNHHTAMADAMTVIQLIREGQRRLDSGE